MNTLSLSLGLLFVLGESHSLMAAEPTRFIDITSPEDGATISAVDERFIIRAEAGDISNVSNVTFWTDDGTWVGRVTQEPFAVFTYQDLTGSNPHVVLGRVTYNDGQHLYDDIDVIVAPPPELDDITNIHSTFGSDALTQVTVSWRSPSITNVPPSYATIEYGTDTGYGFLSSASSFASGGGLQHHAELNGLLPGTTYHYQVRSGSELGPDGTFRTALPADTLESFTFAIVGDVEGPSTGNQFFPALTHFIEEQDVAFFVCLGDLAYYGQDQSGWDGFFRSGSSLFESTIFVPVIGDHSMERLDGGGTFIREAPLLYLDQFLQPDNHTDVVYDTYSLRNFWYSFDYGSAHIVSMENTQELTDPFRLPAAEQQAPWVIDDLAATTASTRFVFGHRSFYPYESEDTAWPHINERRREYRDLWDTIFSDGLVDLTAGAHLGGWILSHPIYNGAMASTGEHGTVHMKLPKVGNYSQFPDPDEVALWSTLLPNISTERIPAVVLLVTVHPDRTEVVTVDWVYDRNYHGFTMATGEATPYDMWRDGINWGGADSAPNGDGEGDGIVNFWEYAMDLNPLTFDSAPVDVGSDPAGPFFQLDYRRNLLATELTWSLQASSNLPSNAWNVWPVDNFRVFSDTLDPDVDGDGSAELMRYRILQNAGDPSLFFRLGIE